MSKHISRRESGFSMIEVLVTLVILLVGLFGLMGLMAQSQRAEMESYQRVQALVLLQDIAGRINANRKAAACYAFTTDAANGTPYLGVDANYTPACNAAGTTAAQQTRATEDMTTWSNLLQGAAETSGTSKVGAMIGARGCIDYGGTATELKDQFGVEIPGTGIYTIAVAWQGLSSTFAAMPYCGKGLYGNEAKRHVVSLTLRTGSLTTP